MPGARSNYCFKLPITHIFSIQQALRYCLGIQELCSHRLKTYVVHTKEGHGKGIWNSSMRTDSFFRPLSAFFHLLKAKIGIGDNDVADKFFSRRHLQDRVRWRKKRLFFLVFL